MFYKLKTVNSINSRLVCDSSVRLGRKGINDFKSHPFFEGIDWDNIFDCKYKSWEKFGGGVLVDITCGGGVLVDITCGGGALKLKTILEETCFLQLH